MTGGEGDDYRARGASRNRTPLHYLAKPEGFLKPGKMGRPPKPIAVHIAEGTYRRDRHGNRGPTTGGEPLRKPDDLTPDASELWDAVTSTRAAWLSSSDAACLRLLCDAYGLMRHCERLLADDPTDKNARCAWSAYHRAFCDLGAKFGLNPSDRARLGEDKPERDERSELEDMLS